MSRITWTPELDAKIVDGIARGLSRAQIAAKLGDRFTRNMVIARHARIRGIRFPSDEAIAKAARDQTAARRRLHKQILTEQLAEMDRRLALGLRRDFVMALARRAGLSLEEIGTRFGITRERVRQICDREGVPSMRVAA